MSKKVLFSLAVVCVGALAFAGTASAQWSGSTVVSNNVEPVGSSGQNRSGVSAARCGSNIVVGFGDSEAGSNDSFAGYAVSSNGGATFIDRGVLPNTPGNGLGGSFGTTVDHDLSVACAGPLRFYYAATLTETNQLQDCPAEAGICSSISVSMSSDGGQSWGMPVVVDRRNIDNHQLEFPAIAADPTSPRVYVAYLDQNGAPFDYSFPDCEAAPITVLRLAVSGNAGATWTSTVVDHVCDFSSNPENSGRLGAPSIVVSPGGKVYLAYEFQPSGFNGNTPAPEIRFTRSVNQGQTFSPSVIVSKTAIDNALPRLAVDRTSTANRGEIYVTWAGSQSGTHTDILISDSLSQGASFSFPRPLSPAPAAGQGRFQTEAVVSVDNDGQVAACYYETPTNSPTSSSVYSYNCKLSSNHSVSWQSQTVLGSVPVGLDALTSDFLLGGDGFFTAFELDHSGTRWVVGRRADN